MPIWREIIESEDYQILPLETRIKTKNEFFRNIISQSDKFKKLSPAQRINLRTNFFIPKSEEKLEPYLEGKPTAGKIIKLAVEHFQQKSPFALLDKPVEEVAKFIEPDTAKAGFIGAAKFIPRQMLAEIVRAYKPSTAGAFGVGMKVATPILKPIVKPIGKSIGRFIPEEVKTALKRNLFVGKGQPQEYQEMAKEALLSRQSGAREAEQAVKVLTTKPIFMGGGKLTIPEQKLIGSIFRKEVNMDVIRNTNPELYHIAQEGRAIMDKWSTELAKSGIPKEQTVKVIEDNIGQYMARMYTTKLKPETGMFGAIKNLRLRLGGLKHRKDLSGEVLRQLGEIKEPALPTAIRVKETSANIANNKLFTKVAQNPEWAVDKNITGNLIKMPDTANVGPLRNKWVIPEIGEDINAIVDAGKQAQGVYLKLLSAWKYGKVVLNPATQVRNAISNTMLLDISGTNHLRQAQLFPKAFNEYLSKGKIYQQALEDGAIGGEFVGGEIKKIKDFYIGERGGNLQKWLNTLKLPFDKAGKIYRGMEQTAKLVKYIDVLEKTGQRKLAANEAQKWLFNYNEVPKIVDWARKSPFGTPFITFCVSTDTQILTQEGWKFSDEIKKEDKTLAYNLKNGNLEWQLIENIYLFEYSGEMLNIKHRSLDILMTPDHRNIVRHRNKKQYINTIKLAKDLNSRDSIIVAGQYQAPINKIVEDDIVQLVGWFVTEGYIIKTTNSFCIGQTNSEGQKKIEELRKRLKVDKYNIQLRRFKLGGYKLHKIYYFPSWLRNKILKLAPDKKLTVDFLCKLTKEQLNILYETILLADGCNSGSQSVIIQKIGITADTIQILGILLDKQFGWSVRKDNCVMITVTDKKYREIKRNKPLKVKYEGIVWCPKTKWKTWVARRKGKIFITGNTYKSIPRLAEALVNRPMTLYKYKAFFDAVNETSRKYQGLLPTEYARQKKLLPPYLLKDIGGIPTNLLMPWKDKYGRTQWLNLEYILPLGQSPEILEKGLSGWLGNPIFNLMTDLSKNSDFRGKLIIPVGADKTEAAQMVINYVYRQLAPSLAPALPIIAKGGYSYEKIMDAIMKRPDFAERTRGLTPVLLDTLMGLKINPLDVDEADKFRMFDKKNKIEDLKKQILKLNHPAISDEEREKQAEAIFQKIQRITDEF